MPPSHSHSGRVEDGGGTWKMGKWGFAVGCCGDNHPHLCSDQSALRRATLSSISTEDPVWGVPEWVLLDHNTYMLNFMPQDWRRYSTQPLPQEAGDCGVRPSRWVAEWQLVTECSGLGLSARSLSGWRGSCTTSSRSPRARISLKATSCPLLVKQGLADLSAL